MKEVKDLYNENYRTLKREIKEDLRRWKDLHIPFLKGEREEEGEREGEGGQGQIRI